MANVHDVAAYILEYFKNPITTMKLQKLCYYSQGWSLAWDEEPLFDSKIQAWANGPVVYDLFDLHRGTYTVSSWTHGDPSALSSDEVDTIDAVLEHYGKLTGQQLSDLTHSERPWLEAREGLPVGASSQKEVSTDSMQDFFSALANA
ncbi:Panacea domain-containing protein [Glutamicibacter ardleyensis]|uniref:Antitoxin SocA-like Panacea domain-containing protein n=1 Tax=Glutamicibacter ardleyensis TaxID=225894 RepID=A0ABQ2DWD5_9MICC|nr:type II toxin-antitoxin system antitoxin SocA domain-containing protein [Glutamicibacter ardleyensis]GGJ72828.1 hypothetical protein GCM10007173_34800 [Glutamicibacter ardleyensis]